MTLLDKMRNAARKNMAEKQEAEAAALPVEPEETPTGVEGIATLPAETELIEEAEAEEDDSTESNNITFTSEAASISWNIDKAPTLLITSPEDNPSPLYQTIIAHVEENKTTLDYFAFDIPGTLVEEPTEEQAKHIATNLDEVWDLSAALLTEIEQRELGKDGKTLLVIINEGHKLFKFEDIENAERYSELLTNMQTVIKRGNSVDIKILMEVDVETAEIESRYDFQNAITFK